MTFSVYRIVTYSGKIISGFLFLIFPCMLFAQTAILEQYIDHGLNNNLGLLRIEDSLQLKTLDQKEARGMFFPQLSVQARYSVAKGGRIIEFPVGDLLNPVYGNLNLINNQMGLPVGSFPEDIENEQFYFYRPTEQETKFQVIQSVINPQLAYNYRIRSEMVKAGSANVTVYKRQLVAEIKKAYYNYLKTLEVNKLLNNTRILLEENIRVNKKLFKNHKITIDNVYRSEAELSKLDQQKAEAMRQQHMAASYFNFLLDRPLNADILVDTALVISNPRYELPDAREVALENREEMQGLDFYRKASSYRTKLHRSGKLPKIYGAVNYGIQGEDYRISSDDDFVLASLVLTWDLFTGWQQQSKVERAKVQEELLKNKSKEAESQILLEVSDAWYALQAGKQSMEATGKQMMSAKKSFAIVKRKYQEGQVSLVEFIDSRTSMTSSEVNNIIAKYDYLIRYAIYERALALYVF